MLCDRCKKNVATFHKSVIINGEGYETHLCEKCANEMNLDADFDMDMNMDMGFGFPNDIFDMFNDNFGFGGNGLFLEKDTKKCPKCGSTFSDFLKRGKLGCDKCYDTFNEEIRDMLENMDNPTDIDLSLTEKPTELEQLENEFNKAIAEERYEDAGKLKQKINELKGVKPKTESNDNNDKKDSKEKGKDKKGNKEEK